MNLTPALDEIKARKIKESIELCGKNRGPHDYVPIEWKYSDCEATNSIAVKRVTRFLCRVCFCNVDISTLLETYEDVSLK